MAHFRQRLWNQPSPGPKGLILEKVELITGCPSTESGESTSAQSVPVRAVPPDPPNSNTPTEVENINSTVVSITTAQVTEQVIINDQLDLEAKEREPLVPVSNVDCIIYQIDIGLV